MPRTPITPSRSFQIRTNGLFKKGNTLFNLLHPKVVVFIHPGSAMIPGCGEALAYASHGREEWPELYKFFDSTGVRPQNICGPDDFDTVAARRSVAPTDRAPAPTIQPSQLPRGIPCPEMPHQTKFLRPEQESQSSDSYREIPFPEMAPMPHQANFLSSDPESQSSESLRVTPVPETTSVHQQVHGMTPPMTEQGIDESLLSQINESLEHGLGDLQFEPQTRPRAPQGVDKRTKALGRPDSERLNWSREGTPLAANKRKAAPDAEGMRKRRSMAGPEDRDRRRKMMTRSQGRGHSFYSK
ncbi:Hypothetical protein NCS54_01370300 [Fusarium falciforme]|uniref:Hypothetical protein n=1 Tax=Fusarium falciforme TaxID=195108 RepID=UPI0023015D5E|nr:Hypothetical protein NCS54_01370300 [Fusarium falciforme]WAO96044.1 Hypothetical protein NCS54_01370300 [Fusarium falciforme]